MSKHIGILSFLIAFTLFYSCTSKDSSDNPADYVDPFTGTGRPGNLYPGAVLPFGMVCVNPECDLRSLNCNQPPRGYRPNLPVYGFSHTRINSDFGNPRYGNVVVIPQTGQLDLKNKTSLLVNEEASPGYFSATLAKGGIKAELTAFEKVGFHRYTFSEKGTVYFIIDPSASLTGPESTEGTNKCKICEVTVMPDNKIQGNGRFEGGWGGLNPYNIYFVAEFNQPFSEFGIWNNGIISHNEKSIREQSDNNVSLGAYVSFNINPGEKIKLKIAISYVSNEKAQTNLDEASSWDFNKIRNRASKIWLNHLNKIVVEGGNEVQKTIFYTALYHSLLTPRDLSGENPSPESTVSEYWDYYSIWNTYRTVNPLLMLILPERQTQMIEYILDIYNNRGWLPDTWIAGEYAKTQGGSNADVVITEAILKNIKGFNYDLAYIAMKKNADILSENPLFYGRFLEQYLNLGYLPVNSAADKELINGTSSRTLEYAYNDYCLSLAAKKLGKNTDYEMYSERSLNALKLFNPETMFFWARDRYGNWQRATDEDYNYIQNVSPLYSGSMWHYSMSAPHLIPKLIKLHGGNKAFVEFLDEFFNRGHFNPGNLVNSNIPWLYIYAGRQDKTAARVRWILDTFYNTRPDGLPGQDISGSLSAWYVWSAIGIYPMAGQDFYFIGSPIFDKTTIVTNSGEKIVIRTLNNSHENKYILSASLNGKFWDKAWFQHKDIINGAELVLIMGPEPSDWGKTNPPPSFKR
jgi:predicted alpha-1,2-mannosidase